MSYKGFQVGDTVRVVNPGSSYLGIEGDIVGIASSHSEDENVLYKVLYTRGRTAVAKVFYGYELEYVAYTEPEPQEKATDIMYTFNTGLVSDSGRIHIGRGLTLANHVRTVIECCPATHPSMHYMHYDDAIEYAYGLLHLARTIKREAEQNA